MSEVLDFEGNRVEGVLALTGCDVFPLSYAQERLWFLWRLDPESPYYNVPVAVEVRGELDLKLVRDTLSWLAGRHESLRTTFAVVNEEPVQVIAPEGGATVQFSDFSHLPLHERSSHIAAAANEEANRPFDLEKGPLWRLTILRLGADDHVLVFNMHHIISDGWSLGVLTREFALAYSALRAGKEPDLEELEIQYADFAQSQKEWLAGDGLAGQWAYWSSQLADVPERIDLVTDFALSKASGNQGRTLHFDISAELANQLRRQNRECRVTLFMSLLTNFSVLLYRYSGQTDLPLGIAIANRNREEIENLIGFFVNSLVLRCDLSGNPSFRTLLERVRKVTLDGFANQDYPFNLLVQKLSPDRLANNNPMFNIMFALQNAPGESLALPGLSMNKLKLFNGNAKFDLFLEMVELGSGGLRGAIEYHSGLFAPESVERLARDFTFLLSAFAANPDLPIATCPLMDEETRSQLVKIPPARAYSRNGNLASVFERRAAAQPDQPALFCDERLLTYGELNDAANRLAHTLLHHGPLRDRPVAVCLERSPEMIITLLAILKAGGCYLGIEAKWPEARTRAILEDAGATLVITDDGWPGELPAGGLIRLDPRRPVTEPDHNPGLPIDALNLAYVSYTSGSSGKPKGVCIPHRAVLRLVLNPSWVDLGPDEVLLQYASLAFDASTFEIWGALLNGSALAQAVPQQLSLSELGAVITRHRVTSLWLTATLFNLMIDDRAEDLQGVRQILVGGEALSVPHMARARRLLPRTRLINGYGPTENTTFTLTYPLLPDPGDWKSIPIGFPIDNSHVHILGDLLEPVPPGVPGELFIGGDGLARGYLADPARTAALFVPDPFPAGPGGRLYKSGDRVRALHADGAVQFLGRLDEQVKIRGFRIEPGEIQAVLEKRVDKAVVRVWQPVPGDKRLVAYVAGTRAEAEDTSLEQPDHWQMLFDQTVYSDFENYAADPTLNLSGWLSSYDGSPIPRDEMRTWLDDTVAKIRALPSDATLEMGCGTGMLLFRVAPGGRRYVGCDISQVALDHVAEHLDRPELKGTHVSLLRRAANMFDDLSGFDLVLLNSVVQYFPSIAYLDEVIAGALNCLNAGGSLFLGDIRDVTLLRHLKADIECFHADPDTPLETLGRRTHAAVEEESELCIDPAYFHGLVERYPRISAVEVLLKRGEAHNELTMFRYDVRLFTARVERERVSWSSWQDEDWSLARVRESLATGVELLALAGLPNARLNRPNLLLAALDGSDGARTIADLDLVSATGVDPHLLWQLGDAFGYETRVYAAGRGTNFDVLFLLPTGTRHRLVTPSGAARTTRASWRTCANRPGKGAARRKLVPELRQYLVANLPAHMVPDQIIVLDEIPLTSGGKVAFRALPAPEPDDRQVRERVIHDKVTEDVLAGIWAGILGLANVGEHDDFFDLGGHSLLATRVISSIREVFGVELPLRRFFEAPTLAALAAATDELTRAAQGLDTPPLLPRGAGDERIPLSYAQQRLWFLFRLEPDSPFYNSPAALRLKGNLHIEALRQALVCLVGRHESLRTRFPESDGEPYQLVDPEARLSLPVEDLGPLPEAEREARLQARLDEEATRPFDLINGPVLRFSLFRMGPDDHVLALTMHHIITDGWSLGILVREFSAAYRACCSGHDPELAELPIQYPDFALWQRGWLVGEALEKRLAYWKRQLTNPPALELPLDKARPAQLSTKGEIASFSLAREVVEALKHLARSEGATLFMGLMAAFKILLMRYTGQKDLVVGSPIANRNRAETEGLIGFFVNMLALRTDLSAQPGEPDPGFRQVLARVRETTLEAYLHQDVPFESIVDCVVDKRDPSRTPIYQVTFGLLNTAETSLELEGVTLSVPHVDTGSTNADISITAFEKEAGLHVQWRYSTSLFEPTSMNAMGRHFQAVLAAVVDWPDRAVTRLPLLSESERRAVLVGANRRTDPDFQTILEPFEKWAASTPDAPALVFEQTCLTYGELNRRANQLARCLRAADARPDALVGICLERGPGQIVGLLAILKTGAGYLPLDPEYPRERLAFMLADAAPVVLLTRAGLRDKLPPHRAVDLLIDAEGRHPDGARVEDGDLGIPVSPDNLGYIIYTSGSTGRPKGVMLHQRGWCNTVAADIRLFELGPGCRVPHFASISFDAAASHIFMALCSGATLYVAGGDNASLSVVVSDLLRTCEITHAASPAAILAALTESELPHLTAVVVGGETCSAELAARWRTGQRRFYNRYGPTEISIYATVGEVTPDLHKPHIGWPIANMGVYVLDPFLEPVPVGVIGELCLAGVGLARGYLGRPDLTALKFVPDPFSEFAGTRLYRSGDLCRFLHDSRNTTGPIDFIGRGDEQVKLRGYRIELGEIEAVLSKHARVRETAVLVRVQGGKTLVAYVQEKGSGETPLIPELRAYLKEALPEYMVPSHFVVLDKFPLTPSGKTDRRALPAPESSVSANFIAPRTELEEQVAAIWRELLHLEKVGVEDNFFEIGGHSLLAVQVISRIRKRLRTELPVRTLFTAVTLAQLSAAIAAASEWSGAIEAPIEQVERRGELPLSFAQQRLWFFDRMDPGASVYNLPMALRLEGDLCRQSLEAAFGQVIRRHETLRTTFGDRGGKACQLIADPAPVRIPLIDLRGIDEQRRDEEARRQIVKDSLAPFNLATGPLIRLSLLRLGDSDHVLLLNMHHITSDGWSLGVFINELSTLYEAAREGANLDGVLEPLPIQYADFAAWQRRRDEEGVLADQLAWWRDHLAGAPTVLELPTDHPRPEHHSTRGASLPVRIPADLCASLRRLAAETETTLFMLIEAAFATLLSRYGGGQDLLIGCPVANRNRAEVEPLIGFFANTMVMRNDLSGDPAFSQLLQRVKQFALGAFANQDIPFEQIVTAVAPQRNLNRNPLVQIWFAWQNTAIEGRVLRDLSLSRMQTERVSTNFDLSLSLTESSAGIGGMLEYNSDLFEAATIRRMVGYLGVLLESIVRQPDATVVALPLIPDDERQALVANWNDSDHEATREALVHPLFEAQVARTPERIAVQEVDGVSVTFRELNCRANRLAHLLRGQGVGPESRVGIYLERCLEMVTSILAVLKAGGAYVPLDPTHPDQRRAWILEDAAISVLITDAPGRANASLEGLDIPIIVADTSVPGASPDEDLNPNVPLSPHNAVYLMYTSGSTGKPKGVLVPHRAVANCLLWGLETYPLNEDDHILQTSSFAFDPSMFELFEPLLGGARCVLAPPRVFHDTARLWKILEDYRITHAYLVPSMLKVLLDQQGFERTPHLKHIFSFAENLVGDLSRRLFAQANVAVHNIYGPTETTFASTAASCTSCAGANTPIGRPVYNSVAYVLDRFGRLLPTGVPGHLHAGGNPLARGYLGQPAQTALAFVPDPYAKRPGARLYRTGDLVRHMPSGDDPGLLEFLGRVDRQIKIRGYRIEPAEIAHNLMAHAGVSEAVVVAREDGPGQLHLVAYVLSPVADVSSGELRAFLRSRLPDYMVPAAFVIMETFPLDPNGKIDRKRLPAPGRSESLSEERTAPRSPEERALTRIWSQVLQLADDELGVNDNFFELGGDSILSIQIIARAREAGLYLTPKQMFQHQTVAELALVAETVAAVSVDQGPVVGRSPLTPVQRTFFETDQPTAHHFNQSVFLRLAAGTEASLLEGAFAALVAHHDALRSRFEDGVQVFAPVGASVPMQTVDLSGSPDRTAAMEAVAATTQASLDMGSLFRAVFFDLGPAREPRLLLVAHHLIIDAVSWIILVEDLCRVYACLRDGKPVSLPAKTTSFLGWSEKLTGFAAQMARAELAYWQQSLRDAACEQAEIAAAGTVGQARTISLSFDAVDTSALLTRANGAYHTRPEELLLAALARSLTRWKETSSVLIEMEGHGREDLLENVDLSRTIGWFTSLYPLRLEAADRAGQQIKSVKEILRNIPNRGLGHGVLRYLAATSIREEMARLPKPSVLFNFLGQAGSGGAASLPVVGWAAESAGPERSPDTRRGHALEISAIVAGGRLNLSWTFNPDQYAEKDVSALTRDFVADLQWLLAHCQSQGAGGHTPSDFPLARIDQRNLDLLDAESLENLYPLSPMQEGMLFHTLYDDSDAYFEQRDCSFTGNMDVAAFREAWRRLVERHAVLRTSFHWDGLERPLQRVVARVELPFFVHDWRGEPDPAQRVDHFKRARRDAGFDLHKAPLCFLDLIRLDERTWRFIWSYHHSLLDGWSMPTVFNELFTLYAAASGGYEPHLPAPVPFVNYIHWLENRDSAAAQAWWTDLLAGFTAPTPLVVEKAVPGPEPGLDAYHEVGFLLPERETRELVAFTRNERLTMSTLVQAIWTMLLYRYTGETDLVFGSTTSGRPTDLAGVEKMVGLFINAVPVRVRLSGEETLLELLRGLHAQHVEKELFSYSPLTQIKAWSDLAAAATLFESLVIYENFPVTTDTAEGASGSLQIELSEGFTQTGYPLTLVVGLVEGLSLRIMYQTERFASAVITRMVGHLRTLLEDIPRHPERVLNRWQLLSTGERDWFDRFNDSASPYSSQTTVHRLFEQQAEAAPEATAVIFGEASISYRQLNQRANQLAHYLIEQGVRPGVMVGVCFHRSFDTVIAVMAVLKAGGAYVPMEKAWPNDRIAFVLADIGADLFLTHASIAAGLAHLPARSVCLDREDFSHRPDHNPGITVRPEDIAYIIFTSGSTGQPKGVIEQHRPVVNLIEWVNRSYAVGPRDRLLFLTSLCFDLSVYDIFGMLAAGGSIRVAADDNLRDPEALVCMLNTGGITFWDTAPAALQQCVPYLPGPGQGSPDLRLIFLSGDWIPLALPDNMRTAFPNAHVVGLGGATEATIWSNFHNLGQVLPEWRSIPYGVPIQNARYYVLDEHLNRLPMGVPGDLFIGGECLSRGYHNRPALTAYRFVPDPHNPVPGAVMYRTGDRARFMEMGELEFLGRLDNQIKIRGYRIELGEVEAALAKFPGVDDAVAIVRDEPGGPAVGGNKRLFAYVASHDERVTPAVLREDLRAKLPEYMVPSAILVLAVLPMTPNGKVDRNALPDPEVTASDNYLAPRNPVERKLAQIWAEVLRRERVGIEDNYFELGGDSIISIQIISRAQAAGLVFSPRQLFEEQTIAALAIVAEVNEEQEDRYAPPAGPTACWTPEHFPLADLTRQQLDRLLDGDRPVEDIYRLTPMQEGMFYYTLYAENPEAYFEQHSWTLRGAFDPHAFEQAWATIVERHPVLRSSFHWGDLSRPVQVVYREVPSVVCRYDWRGEASESRLRDFILQDRLDGFCFERGPLLRISLIRLEDDVWHFVFFYHHLLMDGWSRANVLSEVFIGYAAYARRQTPELPQAPAYGEHIHWLAKQDLQAAKSYWKKQLAGFEATTDFIPALTEPASATTIHEISNFWLSEATTRALEDLSRRYRLTLNTLVQGAWSMLLNRYSGSSDTVFGATVSGRPPSLEHVESMVGLFINSLPVRVKTPDEARLLPLLRELQSSQAEQTPYSYTPLLDIQRWSDVPKGRPLFESLVVFDNYPVSEAIGNGEGRPHIESGSDFSQTNYPLTLVATPGAAMRLLISYDSRRLEPGAIERMQAHLTNLLDQIAADPNRRIGDFSLITERERAERLLRNQTAAPFPEDKCMFHFFEDQVLAQPEATAALCAGEEITYGQLNRRANRLAWRLIDLGVGPGARVGLYLSRSFDLLVAMLAIQKAGGAYVPMETSWPRQRLAGILESCAAQWVVSHTDLQAELPAGDFATLSCDAPGGWPETNPDVAVGPDHLAYIIFTSGSTGQPKGVVLQHRPVVNLIHWVNRSFRVGPADRLLFVTSPCFDLSVYDVFGTLAAGATIYLATEAELADPEVLARVLNEEKITFWDSAPAALQQLVPFLPAAGSGNPGLRLAFLSGDWIPLGIHASLTRAFPTVTLVGLGGATEAAIWSNYHLVEKVPSHWNSIPYGVPIQNAEYHVLDPRLEPAPTGLAGDLYIGGKCLSLGYLNRPRLSADRYIPDPFSARPGTVLYHTGDRARYLPNGELEFLGRLDHQVKIRGYRIELGEIEALLVRHERVDDAVVLVREDTPGNRRLVAYALVTRCEGPAALQAELQELLRQDLPAYMMPAAIVIMARFPVTANGKLDRAALPAPELGSGQERVAPRNRDEEQLVAIWQSVLGTEEIGVRDNFFELGGHSLLAVQLIARVRQTFGRHLPLAAVLEGPTVERFAHLLADRSDSTSPLVAIQKQGSLAPFFCVHPVGGNVLCYAELARELGEQRPFYGLQSSTLSGGRTLSSIEAMAAAYIEAMRQVQTQGPYHLGGWSLGGLIAYEMAQQLRAAGEQVASVVLMDTYIYDESNIPRVADDASLLSHFIYDLSAFTPGFSVPDVARLRAIPDADRLDHVAALVKGILPAEEGLFQLLWDTFRTNLLAGYAYAPRAYEGPLLHLVAGDPGKGVEGGSAARGSAAHGWEELVSHTSRTIPGNHYSIFQAPAVVALARELTRFLDQDRLVCV